MAAQKGRELLLKIGGSGSSETFTTIGGMLAHRMVINETEVDITAKDTENPHWMGLLAGGGVMSMEISGNGIFKDSAAEGALWTAKVTPNTHYWHQFIIPSFKQISGQFQVTSLEYDGDDNDAVKFSATWKLNGSPDIVAV